MKKLMFAAALCATVGLAHGSIESSNIVGYQTPDVKSAVAIGIDTFNPVAASETGFDLQSIKIVAEGIAGGQIQIQTLTESAETGRTFAWIPEAEAADYDLESEGWYDADEGIPAEMTFAAGEGFLTMNDFGEGATLVLPSPLN